jgi:hypothetical protein
VPQVAGCRSGTIAERYAAPPTTLRYWEQIGLLPAQVRTQLAAIDLLTMAGRPRTPGRTATRRPRPS